MGIDAEPLPVSNEESATGTRIIAIAATALGGYLHLKLVRGVYRHAAIREMFLLNVLASTAVVVGLLLFVRPTLWARLVALGGVALSAGSLIAFALSRGPGLPTLHGIWKETGLEPAGVHVLGAKIALVVLITEGIALVAFIGLLTRSRAPSPVASGAR